MAMGGQHGISDGGTEAEAATVVHQAQSCKPAAPSQNDAQQTVIRMLCEALVSLAGPKSNKVLTAALNEAAKRGDIVTLHALAEGGAPIKMPVEDGWTPVEWAACRGHVSVLEALALRGAELGPRAVDVAVGNDRAAAVELLARHGTPLGVADCGGWTPAHCAAMNGYASTLEALAKCGAPLDATDNVNMTPAHYAANNGHVAALEVLLRMHAAMDIRDSNGHTPAELARLTQPGNAALFDLLERHGHLPAAG